jgi:cell division protein FtsN
VLSLGIVVLLIANWITPGRKPKPVTSSVTAWNVRTSTPESVTEPLHREIASLHERIATLEQELAQAQAANEQRKLIEGFKQEPAAKPPQLAEPPKKTTHQGMKLVALRRKHRMKNAARPTKPQKLAHTSARGTVHQAQHPTDIARPLIPTGAVAENSPGT